MADREVTQRPRLETIALHDGRRFGARGDDRPRYARERRGENQHQIQCNDAAPIEETFPQLKRVLMREGLLKGRRAKRLV